MLDPSGGPVEGSSRHSSKRPSVTLSPETIKVEEERERHLSATSSTVRLMKKKMTGSLINLIFLGPREKVEFWISRSLEALVVGLDAEASEALPDEGGVAARRSLQKQAILQQR